MVRCRLKQEERRIASSDHESPPGGAVCPSCITICHALGARINSKGYLPAEKQALMGKEETGTCQEEESVRCAHETDSLVLTTKILSSIHFKVLHCLSVYEEAYNSPEMMSSL